MSIKSRLFSLNSGEDMSKVAELEAQIATLTTELAANAEAVATLSAENEKLATALAEVESAKAALQAKVDEVEQAALAAEQAAQEAAKLAAEEARKAKLVDAVGAEKAEALFASLSVLDDASFESVVGTFAEAKTAVDNSVLFQEQGIGSDGNLNDEDAQYALVSQFIKSSKTK